MIALIRVIFGHFWDCIVSMSYSAQTKIFFQNSEYWANKKCKFLFIILECRLDLRWNYVHFILQLRISFKFFYWSTKFWTKLPTLCHTQILYRVALIIKNVQNVQNVFHIPEKIFKKIWNTTSLGVTKWSKFVEYVITERILDHLTALQLKI